jgi:hypothetical protein
MEMNEGISRHEAPPYDFRERDEWTSDGASGRFVGMTAF